MGCLVFASEWVIVMHEMEWSWEEAGGRLFLSIGWSACSLCEAQDVLMNGWDCILWELICVRIEP